MTLLQEFRTAPAASLILLLTIGVSIAGFCNDKLYHKLQLHPYSIRTRQQYSRLITAGFIHVDILHLVSNCWIFYVFAIDLEKILPINQQGGFLLIYFGGIAFGNFGTFLIKQNNFAFSSAGASAGIIATTVAYGIIQPAESLVILPVIGAIPNLLIISFYTAALIYYKTIQERSGIDLYSHFFGAVAGIVSGYIIIQMLVQ